MTTHQLNHLTSDLLQEIDDECERRVLDEQGRGSVDQCDHIEVLASRATRAAIAYDTSATRQQLVKICAAAFKAVLALDRE